MAGEDDELNQGDIDDLNRAAVDRSAAIARLAGSVIVGVGLVGAAAWAWMAVRSQDQFGAVDLTFGGDDTTRDLAWTERVDLFVSTFGLLLWACLVLGLGLLVRVTADYAQSRVGGSVTGFQVGDRLDDNGNPAP